MNANQFEITSAGLAGELERLLANGDVQAGMRLRSVRDLAATFKVDVGRVRSAIDELAEQGILAKRHGSGTYIRRVPLGKRNNHSVTEFMELRATNILADRADDRSQRRPSRKQAQMTFQVWTDLFWVSPTQDHIAAGLAEVLAPRGHVITSCGGTESIRVPLTKAALVEKFNTEPADGYFVLDWLAAEFGDEFAATGKPWVTFGFTGPIRHQPGMIMDCMEAAERGTRALLEGGCRRVALLGYFDNMRDCDFERFYYTHALRQAGADLYHNAKFVALNAAEIQRALSEMLDSHHPPDGLYVADDNLVPFVAAELERRGIVPGRELAVVTLWNEGLPFESPIAWSRMELSPRYFGQSLARSMAAVTQSANARLANSSILAVWRPGETHILKPQTKGVVQAG
jgi:DNA-binding LacI/PurR family transcriptional regulator/DNA-binding transcriptional regulator YhcF (GntR family)